MSVIVVFLRPLGLRLDEKFHRVESSYGSFMRRFTVPDDANTEGVEATFKDGVLTVKLGKKPAPATTQTKRIPVA